MQPRSELLEKAFNKLMSCGNSRCCICSLMESPNPFSKFQRKKLDALLYQLERESPIAQPPLTVMVKRAMVKLPTSLLPSSQLANPECSDSDLITCSECNICVHRCEELDILLYSQKFCVRQKFRCFAGINFCPCDKGHYRLYSIVCSHYKDMQHKNFIYESRGKRNGENFFQEKISGYNLRV